MKLPLVLCAALSGLSPAAKSSGADLNVFAAASLADALTEIAPAYEALSGDRLRLAFGGSATLARQIKEGAPADLFFSADDAKMDDLARAGLIATETRAAILSNTLVIVVHATDGAGISASADLASRRVRRLALAEPRTVPAGIYAKEYLRNIGLWRDVADKVVPTENVRACLAAVEAGNVDAGIVYRTDALISRQVRVACDVPAAEAPRITYPVAVMKDSKNAGAARRLAAFLASPEARTVFAKYGFLPAGD